MKKAKFVFICNSGLIITFVLIFRRASGLEFLKEPP